MRTSARSSPTPTETAPVTSQLQASGTSLLDLPPEIRLLIYDHLLAPLVPNPRASDLETWCEPEDWPRHDLSAMVNLMLVDRQIHAELEKHFRDRFAATCVFCFADVPRLHYFASLVGKLGEPYASMRYILRATYGPGEVGRPSHFEYYGEQVEYEVYNVIATQAGFVETVTDLGDVGGVGWTEYFDGWNCEDVDEDGHPHGDDARESQVRRTEQDGRVVEVMVYPQLWDGTEVRTLMRPPGGDRRRLRRDGRLYTVMAGRADKNCWELYDPAKGLADLRRWEELKRRKMADGEDAQKEIEDWWVEERGVDLWYQHLVLLDQE